MAAAAGKPRGKATAELRSPDPPASVFPAPYVRAAERTKFETVFFRNGGVPRYTTGTMVSSATRGFDHGAGECGDR